MLRWGPVPGFKARPLYSDLPKHLTQITRKYMKRLIKSTGAMFAALALGFAGTAGAADALSNKDKEFLKNASELGITEVELGRMAQQKATSPELKAHAGKIVADHTKANEELMSLAKAKGVELEAEPNAAQKRKIGAFAKHEGAEFDKEFQEHQVKAHEKAIKEFQEAAQEAKDADVKAFAAKQLPALQNHLAMLKGDASRTTGASDASQRRVGTNTAPATGADDAVIRKDGRGQKIEGAVKTE
jgi:putative membrane protein